MASLLAITTSAACSGGDDRAAPTVPPNTTTAADRDDIAAASAIAERPALPAGAETFTVGTSFQYGAFELTVGHAVWDTVAAELRIGVRARNLGPAWAMPELGALLRTSAGDLVVTAAPVDVPPRRSADVTLEVAGVTADPRDAQLVWGRPDRQQPVIDLRGAGAGEGLWLPSQIALDGWVGIGKYAVRVTSAELGAGTVDVAAQQPPGERVLRLTFDTWTARLDPVNGFFPAEHLTLEWPDGRIVEALESSDGFFPVSWTVQRDSWVSFPVPDPVPGNYGLLLSSLSPKGFSTLRPELIEREALPFELAPPPEPLTDASAAPSLPWPQLDDPNLAPAVPIDVPIDVGTVQVGGFSFRPLRLRWDPALSTDAFLDGEATFIQTEGERTGDGLDQGVLDITPQFAFSAQLQSAGRTATGIVAAAVDPELPTPVTITFLSVTALDPADAVLFIGPRRAAASVLPLGGSSPEDRWPPPLRAAAISSPDIVAGDWTVRPTAWRLGLVRSDRPPRSGMLDLEIQLDVTAAPDATVKALGLSFRPEVQVFLSAPDGYLVQAVAASELLMFEPGATRSGTVVFHVPQTFTPGPLGLVVRGADESTEVTVESWVETTARIVLEPAAEEAPAASTVLDDRPDFEER